MHVLRKRDRGSPARDLHRKLAQRGRAAAARGMADAQTSCIDRLPDFGRAP